MAKIHTTVFKKTCKICSIEFYGTGPAAMYCEAHQLLQADRTRESRRRSTAKSRAASGEIKKPGSGKGGNPLRGSANLSYKHGMYTFETIRHQVRLEVKNCERCDKDLTNVSAYNWCVHHKDHNHWNHTRANLELLCRRCHAIEHKCWEAFTKGATTIPQGSTPKSAEAPDTINSGDDIV